MKINKPISIQEFKARATFYPKGRIIPNSVIRTTALNGKRHPKRHLVKFGSDSWVLHVAGGHLVACDTRNEGSAIRIDGPSRPMIYPNGKSLKHVLHNAKIQGRGNGNWFVGNFHNSDGEWMDALNSKIDEMEKDQ